MALPSALNRDDFLSGKLDAPDPVVRSAMAKVMNPQGLPPMTQKELDRLLNRQFYEEQQVKQGNAYQGRQLYEARQALASRPRFTADELLAANMPGTTPAPQEFQIRNIPGRGESTVVQGIPVRGGPATSGMQPLPTPQPGYGYIQGKEDYLGTTPSGMVRSSEPVVGDQFPQFSAAMQPSPQASVPKSLWDAVPATAAEAMRPTAMATPYGTPPSPQIATPPEAAMPRQTQAPRPSTLGTTLDQLTGYRPQPAPQPTSRQASPQITASNVFSFSPAAQGAAANERDFAYRIYQDQMAQADRNRTYARTLAEDQRKAAEERSKKDLAAARSSFAVGQPLPANIQLNTSQIYEAYIGGMEDRKRGLTTVRMDKDVNGKMVPVDVTTNPLTGERYEAQVQRPVLSAQEQADLEDKKIRMAQGAKEIEKVDTDLQFARKQAELANQITNAIAQGATTGLLAETAATFKSIGEALLDGEYGATTQKLYVQAVQGMSLNQVTNVMRGLGAMSDTDRVAAEKAFVSIRDPKMAVLYYAELSRLNYERAQARQELVDRLTDSGATSDKIRTEISKMKRAEPFLSEVAFKNLKLDRVVANQKSGGMTRLPSSPRGNVKPNNGVEGFIIVDEQP